MTEKRFKHKRNQLGMQFICYDDKTELLGTFADADGVNNIVTLLNDLSEENEQLKASLYAEKTNTAEVVNNYSKQFKRHSAQFSFMMDLADDLGVDISTLEALDD